MLTAILRINIKAYLIFFVFWIATVFILLIQTKQSLLIKENGCADSNRKVELAENTESGTKAMIQKTSEMNDKNIKAVVPLNDFITYPCVEGLSLFPENRWPIEGKCVRTLVGENRNIDKSLCVPLRTLKGTTPICTYPAKIDVHISAGLQRRGLYEGKMVKKLAQFFMNHPELEFLDLGCKIGTYSLSLAHTGVNVTAIDALVDNLKLLHESVRLGNLQQNIRIIWNALAKEHSLLEFSTTSSYNVGANRIKRVLKSATDEITTKVVRAITLDDLVPIFRGKRVGMKMDIEGGEHDAILGGKQFFQEVQVLIIQMEWCFHAKNVTAGTEIVRLLSSIGLVPFKDIHMERPLNAQNVSAWPVDVYFIKG